MLRTSFLCVFAVAAMAQISIPPGFGPRFPGAGRMIESASTNVTSGAIIRYTTVLKPADAPRGSWGDSWVSRGGNTLHRGLVDRDRGWYFGYDLTIAASDDADSFVATFGPLSDVRPNVAASFKPVALPKYPAPQVVRDGGTIEIDLMVSPDGSWKLTDYIQVFARVPQPPAFLSTAPPRDFTIDDGPVLFNPERAEVWVDGQKLERVGFTRKSGATFWIILPGKGRYVLSLTPHDGFTKSGAVRNNVISFRDGDQQYEIRTFTPIAGIGKAYNLYMLHDAAYEPLPNLRDTVLFGTDRLENLLPKR
ncbi:MAG: hypothetical protein ABFD89_28680 [Bryobacteraceae bacterium]